MAIVTRELDYEVDGTIFDGAVGHGQDRVTLLLVAVGDAARAASGDGRAPGGAMPNF